MRSTPPWQSQDLADVSAQDIKRAPYTLLLDKTQLMTDFDFDAYNHDEVEAETDNEEVSTEVIAPAATVITPSPTASSEEVDKW